MALPVVAIIGRPNVGKSTFFNRLVGSRYAITSPVAGTTRDRIYHETELGGYRVILVDTAGMEFDKKSALEASVQAQARIAVEEADLVLFVIDALEPLTVSDRDCADYLRKNHKSVILIAHKADNKKSELHYDEIFELGLGAAISISSIHNFGLPDLDLKVEKTLKKMKWKKERAKKSEVVSIAIVGKPNVGKSSLVNALLGEKRLIVSEVPGTTIDATDTPFEYEKNKFILTDTAGLRRRGKIGKGIERYGVLRSLGAISRSEVACLVLDYAEGLTNQDLHVSEYILEAGRGLIVVVNKSDLIEDNYTDRESFMRLLTSRMNYMPWAPVIFTSALKRKNIFEMVRLSKEIAIERQKEIPPQELSLFIKLTVLAHPPAQRGQKILIKKVIQKHGTPPLFVFSTNKPDLIHFSYRRFLENELRRKYGFYGTPIRLDFTEKGF